ncbi:MAG: alpha/beta hydrolase [Dehalococcoidia bacterium]|nr:alpha/beta hydrolase [Dehalococcoidia bacterium]MSQ17020.1 alpha/beta hydrolase [Dehalococcoidia bacterium]
MPTVKLDPTLEMYYEDDDYTDPWRQPETIVLHHGNAKSSRLWYAWVPLLARQYRVIRLDARGFGRSSVPPEGYPWSLSNFATDLQKLLDHLKLDKVHLIGETVGGTICLQFAHEHPERLHSLAVCTSPYKFAGVGSYVTNRNQVMQEGVEAWARKTAGQRLEPGKSDPAHREWYIQQMGQTSRRVVLETLAYLSSQDLSPILPKIQTPTLVLVAKDSQMNSAERAQGMASLLPNGRLVEIAGATGYVQHSAPEKCVDAWREFIGRVSAAKAAAPAQSSGSPARRAR